jgi:dTDP-4-amino-4,6-dideoxygalactose transaminase
MNPELALFGGPKSCDFEFPRWPVFDQQEETALVDVCRSGLWWLPSGWQGSDLAGTGLTSQVVEFGKEFGAFHDVEFASPTSSGTAALDTALRAFGFQIGDEVIVPAYTYIATATCALQNNLVPIFADIDPETYNLDPARVEEAITDRTRAVIPVHFAGQVADMDALRDLCDRRGLRLIEDAAHAHGAEWRGAKAGSLGDAGVFSFQGSKNMTAGEGGAVTTSDAEYSRIVDSLIWGGREIGQPWYEVHRLGWTYRMTEFQAALLRVQLARIDAQNAQRERAARRLDAQLAQIEGLQPLRRDERATRCAYHLYVLRIDPAALGVPRAKFLEALAAEGVPAFAGYEAPLYANPLFRKQNFINGAFPLSTEYHGPLDYDEFAGLCPATEKACREESIWMTHNLLLAPDDHLDAVAEAIGKVAAQRHRLSRA